MTSIAIIPARYASTRFPGKPLAMLAGKPLIYWAYANALKSFERVVVATDDRRIADAVHAFGGEAVMTSSDHTSGTSRVNEAYRLLDSKAELIVNLQGDEPFISEEYVSALIGCFSRQEVKIATLVSRFPDDTPYSVLADENTVKVVVDDADNAMLFSRSVIPHIRGKDPDSWASIMPYYKHIGVYAFRAEALGDIVHLPATPLDAAESLEQLRWLQYGYKVHTCVVEGDTVGIDTPADLDAASQLISKNFKN